MADDLDQEGYLYAIESIINYLKNDAPKGIIIFFTILIILLLYTVANAMDYLSIFF